MISAAPEALLWSLLLGAGLGLLFTALEIIRIVLSLGRVMTFLLDVLFCAVSAGTTFILALAVSAGNLRFYQLGCEILGFACVFLTLTYAVRRFLPGLIQRLERFGERVSKGTIAVAEKILRKRTEIKPTSEKKCGFFGFLSKKNEKNT